MNIFITGATGRLANYVIDYLKEFTPQANLYGLVRSANSPATKSLIDRGVTVRVGDYADRPSLIKAFTGMDRLLFISFPNAALSANVVAAAQSAGIKFIAYTSINGINYKKTGLELNHRQTEKLIRESGISHTFLRNSWYLEMELGPFTAALATNKYFYLSNGLISYATRREYAEAAARVMASADYPEILELGRKAVTPATIGHSLEKATGKQLDIEQVTADVYQQWLAPYSKYGFEINMAKYVQRGNNGEDQVTPTDFERTVGHPLPPLSTAIKDILNMNSTEVERKDDREFKGYK